MSVSLVPVVHWSPASPTSIYNSKHRDKLTELYKDKVRKPAQCTHSNWKINNHEGVLLRNDLSAAYLAKCGPDISYYRRNNPKQ